MLLFFIFFFFNDPATTEIYTLSLHDALPISFAFCTAWSRCACVGCCTLFQPPLSYLDRKSTRLNSSHSQISYAVFCLKKKKKIKNRLRLKIIIYILTNLRQLLTIVLTLHLLH